MSKTFRTRVEHDLLVTCQQMFELLRNLLNRRNEHGSNVSVAVKRAATPATKSSTRRGTVSHNQPACQNVGAVPPAPASPPAVPVAPPPTPINPAPVAATRTATLSADAGDIIALPLANIIARFPEEFIGVLNAPPGPEVFIALPLSGILPQLAKGAVRVPFGEIRGHAPAGVFVNFDQLDTALVTLPLDDILARLNPALLPRRTAQRKVVLPDSVPAPFAPTGSVSQTDVQTASRVTNKLGEMHASAPARAKASEPIQPTALPLSTKAPAPAPNLVATVTPAPTRVVPAAVMPPPAPVPVAIPAPDPNPAPVAMAPTQPAARTETSFYNTTASAPSTVSVRVAAASAHGVPRTDTAFATRPAPIRVEVPRPVTPPAPVAPTLVAQASVAPQTVSAEAKRETSFYKAGCLRLPLSRIMENWPAAVVAEVNQHGLLGAQVEVPVAELEPGLRQGKLSFTWQQLRGWLSGLPKTASSPNDGATVELPLRLIAPLFLSQRGNTSVQKRVDVPQNIPNLFAPGSCGFSRNAPAAEPAAAVTRVSVPVVTAPSNLSVSPAPSVPATSIAVEPVAVEPVPTEAAAGVVAAEPAPEPAPAPKPVWVSDTTVIPRTILAIDHILGEPGKMNWTPTEIVRKTAGLKGVQGAVICTQDGLTIAENYTSLTGIENFCALITQMFNRVINQAKELRVGFPSRMNFVAENQTYEIFRAGRTYYTVISHPGERVPLPELLVIAEHLAKQSR